MEVSPYDTLVVPERHSQVASFWFSQARRHLIDLEIGTKSDLIGSDEDPIDFSVNFMIQLVLPRAERIRSLHLSFGEFDDIILFLQYQDDDHPYHVWSFPNLEYLTIDLRFGNLAGEESLRALQFMPKLHTVDLRVSSGIEHNELDIHLPWSQLTSLTIQVLPECPFRVLMTQCLALETGYFSIEIDPGNGLPTTLARLTSLHIHFLGPSNFSIFDGIYFPALDDFMVHLAPGNFVWTAPEHMFRQLASITTLSLGARIAAADMINILRATKNVTTFKIEFEDGHGEVFKALTLGGGQGGSPSKTGRDACPDEFPP